jgi:hypothetical protein
MKEENKDYVKPKRKLEKDLEREAGGPGVYLVDLKKHYLLAKEEWRYDIMPEIMDGKNIADFVDPDIEEKLKALEEEETQLEKKWQEIKESELDDDESDLDEETKELAQEIQEKKMRSKFEHQLNTTGKPRMPRTFKVCVVLWFCGLLPVAHCRPPFLSHSPFPLPPPFSLLVSLDTKCRKGSERHAERRPGHHQVRENLEEES